MTCKLSATGVFQMMRNPLLFLAAVILLPGCTPTPDPQAVANTAELAAALQQFNQFLPDEGPDAWFAPTNLSAGEVAFLPVTHPSSSARSSARLGVVRAPQLIARPFSREVILVPSTTILERTWAGRSSSSPVPTR